MVFAQGAVVQLLHRYGPMTPWVTVQVNVRELVCCDEPDKFGSVRAIPDFKVCLDRPGLSCLWCVTSDPCLRQANHTGDACGRLDMYGM